MATRSSEGERGGGVPPIGGKVVPIGLDDELAESYGRYAQAIILDRAIPDARDGLKPVQRRILYAMYESGNTHDKPYRKSAKTVGDVMGNYHPHGDQSIYDALVRLAQPWKVRYPLIDGHGNFGSVDDDPPAAMRYTEARLSRVSSEILQTIQKSTVDWRPNFDDKSLEPTVLPARFPNLLCNGTSGVSTGFATEIPPHNLTEVIEAAIAVLDRPEVELDELMEIVKGPDFPTGGILTNLDGLRDAYERGKGRVLLQARWTVEPQRDGKTHIVISELPYGVVKSRLVGDLDGIRIDKSVVGMLDARDESDREGLRVVVELSKTANVEGVLGVLLKKTDLQTYYHFNMVAIYRGRPCEMGLKELLEAFVEHQREVVRRRSEHDLARFRARLHIVQGLILAVDILDDIIAVIRASQDRAEARDNLVEGFEFSTEQADAILDLRLHRLTNLQILDLRGERDSLVAQIEELEAILGSDRKLRGVIRSELRALEKDFGDPRRTEIRAEVEKFEVSVEATVKSQDVVVALSREGYVRRSAAGSFRAAGETISALGTKDGDAPIAWARSNTRFKALVLTEQGVCFAIPVHQLPDDKWTGGGTALINVVPIDKSDRVVALFSVDFQDGSAVDEQLLFATERGYVKRTALVEFDAARSSGIVAINLQPKDRVVAVLRTKGEGDVIFASREGMAIRFRQADVSIQGRSARGVRGMGLDPADRMVGAALLPPSEQTDDSVHVAVYTEQGKAKRTPSADIPRQLRAGKGSRIVRAVKRGRHFLAGIIASPPPGPPIWVFDVQAVAYPLVFDSIPSTVRDGNAFSCIDTGVTLGHWIADEVRAPEGDAVPEGPDAGDGDGDQDDVDGELEGEGLDSAAPSQPTRPASDQLKLV